MSPRPHDADEPDEPRTDDDVPGADDVPRDDPADPGEELDEELVAERWAGIVSELSVTGDPRSWSPDPAAEEAETHFVPPDPGPVLGGDPLLTMAWVTVVGVPLLLLVAVVWRDMPGVLLRAGAVAFVVAIGVLLWRMPRERSEDDGPGAVV